MAVGCSSMTAPRLSSSVSEVGSGGWLLNMKPKRPSVVGLWTTKSIPRSSAPWGGVGASSSAAAVGTPGGVIPAAVAAVPSEAAADTFKKPRRLMPRAWSSDITISPEVGLLFPVLHAQTGYILNSRVGRELSSSCKQYHEFVDPYSVGLFGSNRR